MTFISYQGTAGGWLKYVKPRLEALHKKGLLHVPVGRYAARIQRELDRARVEEFVLGTRSTRGGTA